MIFIWLHCIKKSIIYPIEPEVIGGLNLLYDVFILLAVVWLVALMITATYTLQRRDPPKYIGVYANGFLWIMIIVFIVIGIGLKEYCLNYPRGQYYKLFI